MSKHIVIDNIIPESLQNQLLEDINILEWTYRGSTNLDTDDHTINNTTYDVGQLSSGIIYTGYRNDYVDVLQPLINSIENHLGKIKEVLRIKYNMLWQCNDVNGRHNNIHHDSKNGSTNLTTVLYYVNDADGDTKIFYPEGTVSISPKKGRVLIFPAHILHAGCNPEHSKHRIVINLILEIEK